MPKKPTEKKRRARSLHPGVKIKTRELPSGATVYGAVFKDPDTGRETYFTLTHEAMPTAGLRLNWCKEKSKALARRRAEIELGAPRLVGTALDLAIKDYFDAPTTEALRERTRSIYRSAADKLIAYCKRQGIESVDKLTCPVLLDFRDSLIAEKKRSPKKSTPTKKVARGGRVETAGRRSAASINQELRSVRTVLGYLHERKKLPKLSYDDLRSGLKLQKDSRELPVFLRPEGCRQLIEAALRHDDATHLITRDEKLGLRPVGSTERYDPIAPFVVFCLLSGCRFGEALGLRWSDVHLNALDSEGAQVGEILLQGTAVKTGHARKISLDKCPGLRSLLAALKLRAGEGKYVFGGAAPMSRAHTEAARKRLLGDAKVGTHGKQRKRGAVRKVQVSGFGAPTFSWQILRSTCATVSCNAPSLWGGAAHFIAAKRLGHSVVISEKKYAGQLEVSAKAKTLEDAMQIADLVAKVVQHVAAPEGPRLAVVRELRA